MHFYIIILHLCFTFNSPKEEDFHVFYINWLNFIMPLYCFDMVQNFNAGYFKNGLQMLERKDIIKNYLKSEFIYDCISIIALSLDLIQNLTNLFSNHIFAIKLFFFLKYRLLNKILLNFEEIINFNEKFEALLSLVKLFMKMLFLAHITACVWCSLPHWIASDQNWMQEKGIMEQSIFFKYEISLYWAIVTIATIGYGDITPQNKYEFMFTTFIVTLGSIFFGYLLSSIASILEEMHKDEKIKKY